MKQYAGRIPEELWYLFLPELPDELEAFSEALKSFRLREEERNYVMELQREYDIPIRPNESVKQTMIRVRLESIRERKHRRGSITRGELPIDPLE